MILPDVNVLVYALRPDDERQLRYRAWVDELRRGSDELALLDLALLGVVRIVTNPRIYREPTPTGTALGFVRQLRRAERARWISSGPQTWGALEDLVSEDPDLRGAHVPDAYLAATAIAHGARLATAHRGFARFPGLRWFDPAA